MQAQSRDDGRSIPPDAIRTPSTVANPLLGQAVLDFAARIGVRVLCKPIRFGKTVIAARHRDVEEVLRRDLDFRIAPINAERIESVNGPFVLGMDRSDQLTVERRALYSALSAIDLKSIHAEAGVDADGLIAKAVADGEIDAVGGYARVVAGHTAQRLFGIGGPDEPTFREVARAIFAHTFLNIGGDEAIKDRALKAAEMMKSWFEAEIQKRRQASVTGDDFMGALMRQPALRGDDDAVRRILGGMLVGSIDTTASSVAKILAMFGRDDRLFAAARRDADDLALTLGWCREALRRWPHNPVILRQTVADTALNGVAIPAGCKIFAWTQAAMQDVAAFPEPRTLRADRPAAGYLHFGGGLHPCAGRAINDVQIPMLVSKLLKAGIGKVGRIAWAGPFPDHQTIRLGKM